MRFFNYLLITILFVIIKFVNNNLIAINYKINAEITIIKLIIIILF